MLSVRPIIAPTLLLTGCALVPAAPREAPPQSLMLAAESVTLPGDSEGGLLLRSAEQAVRAEFNRRGVRVVGSASFRAEVALARRGPKVAFSAAGNSPVDAKPQDGRIDLCREQVFRLTVAIFDSRNAATVYRGSGERVRCGEPDAGELTTMAEVALGSLR